MHFRLEQPVIERYEPSAETASDASGAGVQLASQSGLLSGSSILVQNTLGGSLVDLLDGNAHSLSFISSVGLDSDVGFLHIRLQCRIDSLIPHGLGGDHFHALLGRLNIRHGHTSFYTFSRTSNDSMKAEKLQVFFENSPEFPLQKSGLRKEEIWL